MSVYIVYKGYSIKQRQGWGVIYEYMFSKCHTGGGTGVHGKIVGMRVFWYEEGVKIKCFLNCRGKYVGMRGSRKSNILI